MDSQQCRYGHAFNSTLSHLVTELISNGNGEVEKKEEEKKVPNIKVVHFGVV